MNELDKVALDDALKLTKYCNDQFKMGFEHGFIAACKWRGSQVGEPIGYLYHDGPTPEQIPGDMMGTVCFSRKKLFHARNETPLYAAPPTAQINQQLVKHAQAVLENDGGEGSKCFSAVKLFEARENLKAALQAARDQQ
ncbi:MAG TPA: hypothetical protein VFV57_05860 [Limnobacter sp.]|nr:hypothetical protein [Limnobacter sp.]